MAHAATLEMPSKASRFLIIRLLHESTIHCAKLGSTPLGVAVC
jgi:hypothetical protein